MNEGLIILIAVPITLAIGLLAQATRRIQMQKASLLLAIIGAVACGTRCGTSWKG